MPDSPLPPDTTRARTRARAGAALGDTDVAVGRDPDAVALFAGSGEMRARCRALDWAATPLGPVGSWSQSLRTTATTVLASRNPMFLWWGPALVQFYNDAYRPSLGESDGPDARHPRALGASGRAFWDDTWPVIGPQIEAVLTRGEATWHEDQHLPIWRDGRMDDAWWTYSYSPVRDDDGTIGGVLVTCQENTARVQATASLAAREARLATVLGGIGEGLLALDAAWRYTYVNEPAARLLGADVAAFIGRTPWEVFPGVARPLDDPLWAPFRAVMATRQPATFEHWFPDWARCFEHRLYPTDDGGVLLFFRDVTAERLQSTALASSEALAQDRLAELEAVYRSAPVGMCVFDRSLRYVRINERLAEINGIPAAAHLGRTVRELLPDLADTAEAVLRRILDTGEALHDVEFRGTTPAQPGVERIWIEQWLPLRDAAGDIVGVHVVAEEVTEVRQAMAERERLLARERDARLRAERLQALTAALAGAPSPEAIADAVVREGVAAVGAVAGSLVLVRPDAPDALLARMPDDNEAFDRWWQALAALEAGPIAAAKASGASVHLASRTDAMEQVPTLVDTLDALGLAAFTVVPLVARHDAAAEVLGVLTYAYDAPRATTTADAALLATIASQCVQALERARLAERERAARQQAERRAAVSAALAAAHDPQAIARVLVEQARLIFGATDAGVALVTEDGTAFRMLAAVSPFPDRMQAWAEFPTDPHIPYGHVLATGAPLVLRSYTEYVEAFPALADELAAVASAGLIAMPVVGSDGTCFGVAHLGFSDPTRASRAIEVAPGAPARASAVREVDVEAIRAIVDQVAVALERARILAAEREARTAADAARARAVEANAAKTQFLATMSHELRTPLNAIQGHVQLLDLGIHGEVTAPQREALARIGRAQQHLLGLITDILNFTRLDAGRVEFARQDVMVRDVVRQIVPFIEPQIAAKGLVLDVSLPVERGEPAVWVTCDPDKLGQVLLNLLTNALKFTPARQGDGTPGRITIEVTPADAYPGLATIEVRDTGIGIPPDKLEAIFEPFVQVSAGLARNADGAGLGLAISRGLARGMAGDLTAWSTVGEGSRFRVVLPQALPPATAVASHQAPRATV